MHSSNLRLRPGPCGLHLYNRSTGVNILFDEFQVGSELWAQAPRYVSIALTNSCDLSCPYCYAPKHRAALDFGILRGWLNELDVNGCLGVGFGGGEPTLYRHFTKVCQYAAHDTGLAVSFTSHAHRLNADLAAELAGYVHFVRISMDGVGETYEELRGRSFSAFCSRFRI